MMHSLFLQLVVEFFKPTQIDGINKNDEKMMISSKE